MEELLGSLSTQSADTMVISEAIKVISTLKCSNGLKSFIKLFFSGAGKILVIFALQHHLRNAYNLTDGLRPIARSIFYRSIRFDTSGVSLDLCIANRLKRELGGDTTKLTPPEQHKFQQYGYVIKNGFPIYYSTESEYGVLQMIPWIHRSYYRNVVRLAKLDHQEHLKAKEATETICNTLEEHFTPKNLFPSKNYKRLNDIISTHFEISRMTQLFSTLGILLDGEPGLGKSASIEYLARQSSFGEVLKIDMTTQLDKSFEAIKKEVFNGKKKHTLIVLFDELDKYLDYTIRSSYQKYKQELNADEKKKDARQIPQKWADYFVERKEKFLYELLSMLESNYFDHGVVFIFCSNNFDTIFEGVDQKHFESLKKRFLRITFERCVCEEFKDYVRFFNEKFEGTRWHRQKEDLERLLFEVRSDLDIPYRQLCHLNISSCYNVEKFVQAINAWDDDITPPHSPLLPRIRIDKDEDDKGADKVVDEDDEDDEEVVDEVDEDDKGADKVVDEDEEDDKGADKVVEEVDKVVDVKEESEEVIAKEKRRSKCVKGVKYQLDSINNTLGSENKAQKLIEFLELMSTEEYIIFMKEYPKFSNTVKAKIDEFKNSIMRVAPNHADDVVKACAKLDILMS